MTDPKRATKWTVEHTVGKIAGATGASWIWAGEECICRVSGHHDGEVNKARAKLIVQAVNSFEHAQQVEQKARAHIKIVLRHHNSGGIAESARELQQLLDGEL